MSGRNYTRDDANLNTGSIIVARQKKYSDFNILFEPNPNTGDIYLVKDAAAVKQAVKNIIVSNTYERPFGGAAADVRKLLFDNITPFTLAQAKNVLIQAIHNNEPRARVKSLGITPSEHTLNITVEITVISTQETLLFTVNVERLR